MCSRTPPPAEREVEQELMKSCWGATKDQWEISRTRHSHNPRNSQQQHQEEVLTPMASHSFGESRIQNLWFVARTLMVPERYSKKVPRPDRIRVPRTRCLQMSPKHPAFGSFSSEVPQQLRKLCRHLWFRGLVFFNMTHAALLPLRSGMIPSLQARQR